MAEPKREKEEEVEVVTPEMRETIQWMDSNPMYKDQASPMRRDLIKFLSNRHLPLDDQIQLHLTSLSEHRYGSLTLAYSSSLPRLQLYESLRYSVGSFVRQGDLLLSTLKENLRRWNPDLQAVAAAAEGFAGIAQSIGMPQMVSLGKRLESLSLAGDNPPDTYRAGYDLVVLYAVVQARLCCLISLLNEALNTPPDFKPSALHPPTNSSSSH